MNFATLLRDHAHAAPGRVALRSRASNWTWTDLDALVDRAAAGLLASGASTVAVALPNDLQFVVAFVTELPQSAIGKVRKTLLRGEV